MNSNHIKVSISTISDCIIPNLIEKNQSLHKLYTTEKIRNNYIEKQNLELLKENEQLKTELILKEQAMDSILQQNISLQTSNISNKIAQIEENATKLREETEQRIHNIISQKETQINLLQNELYELKKKNNEYEIKIQKLLVKEYQLTQEKDIYKIKYNDLINENNQLKIDLNNIQNKYKNEINNNIENNNKIEKITNENNSYAKLLFKYKIYLSYIKYNKIKIPILSIIPWKGKYSGYIRFFTNENQDLCFDIYYNLNHHIHYIYNIIELIPDTKNENRFIIHYSKENKLKPKPIIGIQISNSIEGEYILESKDKSLILDIIKQMILYVHIRIEHLSDDDSLSPLPPLSYNESNTITSQIHPFYPDIIHDYESFFYS
ncbi:hypothetical protein WA158_000787 [Blastocystis sp. Blastoise]